MWLVKIAFEMALKICFEKALKLVVKDVQACLKIKVSTLVLITKLQQLEFSHARRPTTPAIKDSENGRCLLLECCTYFRGFQIDDYRLLFVRSTNFVTD